MDDAAKLAAASPLAEAGLRWALRVTGSLPAPTRSTSVVCTYLSLGDEPPTGQLLEALYHANFRVFVPVCESDYALSWVAWRPGIELVQSVHAPVLEPVGPRFDFAALENVAALMLPALAVDGSGTRLGQGGGYYDRFLAGLPSATSVGTPQLPVAALVYSTEFLPAVRLPCDSLDQRVNWAITPAGSSALPLPERLPEPLLEHSSK